MQSSSFLKKFILPPDVARKSKKQPPDPEAAYRESALGTRGDNLSSFNDQTISSWTPIHEINEAFSDDDLSQIRAQSQQIANTTAGSRLLTVRTNTIVSNIKVKAAPRMDLLERITGQPKAVLEECKKRLNELVNLYIDEGVEWDTNSGFDRFLKKIIYCTDVDGDVMLKRVLDTSGSKIFKYRWQLIKAARIKTPDHRIEGQQVDNRYIYAGVETDETGQVLQYHVVKNYLSGMATNEFITLKPSRNPYSIVNNILYTGLSNLRGHRGLPIAHPVIKNILKLDKYTDASIVASINAAIVFATNETDYGHESVIDVMEAMSASNYDSYLESSTDAALSRGAYNAFKQSSANNLASFQSSGVNSIVIPESPYSKFKIQSPEHPHQGYSDFIETNYKPIAAAYGVPYEEYTLYYNKSYSASRMSKLSLYDGMGYPNRRTLSRVVVVPICNNATIEAVVNGMLDLPGFVENPLARMAWLNWDVIGDSMPIIDEGKHIAALIMAINGKITSIQRVANDYHSGIDWKENILPQLDEEQRLLFESELSRLEQFGGKNSDAVLDKLLEKMLSDE